MEIYNVKLSDRFLRSHTKLIAKLHQYASFKSCNGEYAVYVSENVNNDTYYYIVDGATGSVVSFLLLETLDRWKAKEESIVWTAEAHRGKGLIQQLYDTFIIEDRGILVSDELHTHDAIRMWKKFVRTGRYNISAIDMSTPTKHAHVYWDDEHQDVEFAGNIPELWFDTRDRHMMQLLKSCDVRLVAHQ